MNRFGDLTAEEFAATFTGFVPRLELLDVNAVEERLQSNRSASGMRAQRPHAKV